jgi:ferredoxin-NADP reductase
MSSESPKEGNERLEHVFLTAKQKREPHTHAAQIVQIEDLSPTVKSYTLKMYGGGRKNFAAGQWVDFFIPGLDMVGGFSICGPPSRLENESLIDLAVKYSEWPPANWLHTSAKVGSEVSVQVGGDFYYPNPVTNAKPGHEVLLVAGGVGINPLASIFLHISDVHRQGVSTCEKVHLMFSARTKEEHLFKADLDRTVNTFPATFSVHYIATSESDRRIDRDSLKAALSSFESPNNVVCFVCGPPTLVKEVDKHLQSLQVPKNNICYELWW